MDMNPMAYVSIAVTLFITGANCTFWAVTKFNDLKHLTKDVSEIKGDVKTLVQNSQKLEVRMATQEEHCKIMHKRIRRNRTPEKNT